MKLPDVVDENLSFLLAELDGQLSLLGAWFAAPSAEGAARLVARAGYSRNLAARVRRGCLAGPGQGRRAPARALLLESVERIAGDLERLSGLGRRAVAHAGRMERRKPLRAGDYVAPLAAIRAAVGGVQGALRSRDSAQAAAIGAARRATDDLHAALFAAYAEEMRGAKRPEDLAHALLALHEIHRMGDALQGISEALLSINIGQAVHFERWAALNATLEGVGGETASLRPLAETRSGGAISSVALRDAAGGVVSAVFKDGERRKVKEERLGVRNWNARYPGLAPEILYYRKNGDSAALLIEHLDGETFQDIVLGGPDARLEAAQKALHRTLRDIWRKTRTEAPAQMNAMEQLSKRLPDVWRMHPKFARGPQRLQGLHVPGFAQLAAEAARREAAVRAPFSVWIHGDFNLDNVIFDPDAGKIRFIDLHRSRNMDYVQDVSVFMVSNYRLPAPDAAARRRITQAALGMHQTAERFARASKDRTWRWRLALGLARSFASSTRFVTDRDHARRMMLRARYLLETALAVPEGREAQLRLPMRMLFSD